MDISRRNPTKKGNKENAVPAYGTKHSRIRNGSKTVSAAPLHSQSVDAQQNKRVNSTQVDKQLEKAVHAVQKNASAMPAGKTNNRQTISKAFLTEQAIKQRKIIEAAKPPAPQPHSKPAPGLYKGKVVQSKIGAIWKSSAVAKKEDHTDKPSTSRVESRKDNNLTKMRSRSVADLPLLADQKQHSRRPKSVTDVPLPVPKRPFTTRPPTALRSAPPPPRITRPMPPSSARVGAVTKGTETRVVRDKVVNKPPISSSLSQYRMPIESADERRAKLADWLASKGKVLKRPARSATVPVKTKCTIKHHVESKSAVQHEPEPKPSQVPAVFGLAPVLSTNQPGETARVEDPASDASSPLSMNATLDLLNNSDMDLPVFPEPRVNDIVVNLCEALSALATNEDEPQQKDQSEDCEMAEGTANEEKENIEMPENVPDCKEEAEVKEDVETESDEYSEEEDDCKECEIDEEKETKMIGDASSVKYNIKTTPYLQSVKRGLQGEVRSAGAASRKKPGIRDLKFLTPVRRSSRIHRNSSRLPPMVLDHDPCVTSLAELVQLDGDGDANAYIYRKNPALLKDSQDTKDDLSEYF